MSRFRLYLAPQLALLLALPALPARAQLLDDLLPAPVPDQVPGYGHPFSIAALRRQLAPGATGFSVGGLTAAPSFTAATGYDSAPNNAPGAALVQLQPALLLTDPLAGFGAIAQLAWQDYPAQAAQNQLNTTLVGGERLQLPRETLTFGAAWLHGAQTGFALTNNALATPLGFSLTNLRAADDITAGLFTLTPEFAYTLYSFPSLPRENRSDTRLAFTGRYDDGAPLGYVLQLHTTLSSARDPAQASTTYAALAGLQDQADGLWTLAALAGAAWRTSAHGAPLSAPVLELRADWAPSRQEALRLGLAHEIDSPDRLSASPFTLSQARLSISQEYFENITIKGLAQAAQADYIGIGLKETLLSAGLDIQWQMSPGLALAGHYLFNDRQANELDAANEHVVTIGLDWTP